MTTPEIEPDAPISGTFEPGSLNTKASAAERADHEIERQEAPAAERLLDIVGEHPDEDQIADQVHDVGMQELVGEQRQPRAERAGKL